MSEPRLKDTRLEGMYQDVLNTPKPLRYEVPVIYIQTIKALHAHACQLESENDNLRKYKDKWESFEQEMLEKS